MSLGENVRRLRKNRGLSLEALSEKVDISISYLSEIERDVKSPSISVLRSLAQALGTNLATLLNRNLRFGNKLKMLREVYRYSIPQLSKLCKLPEEDLAAFEGESKVPTMTELEVLADTFNVTIRYFIEESEDNCTLGAKLKQTREKHNLSLDVLSSRTRIPVYQLKYYESDRAYPTLADLELIAEALGVSVCYFLLEQERAEKLLATLSPDMLELLEDPRVQGLLRSVRDFNKGELKFVLNQVQFFKKYKTYLEK